MSQLPARLSLLEAVGLSLSVLAPTVAAAFNITLVVKTSGPATPLTLALSTAAMVLIALSFAVCARRTPAAGSASAYIAAAFGNRLGFLAGWSLLLTYLGFATGSAALVGSFTAAGLRALGVHVGSVCWLAVGLASLVAAWWLAHRDVKLAGRLMLGMEAIALLGIIGLCIAILAQAHATTQERLDAWRPTGQFGGWSGLGVGLMFGVLCFAGFEGAATLGEETLRPHRNIPIALMASVLGSGLFFVFVAYCEVIGFGSQAVPELARSDAPLDWLAVRYAWPSLAPGLDFVTAVSCFAGVLGGLVAAARVLFALGRGGLSVALAAVHPVHGTPARSVALAALLMIVPFMLWAPLIGARDFYNYTSVIGVLPLILIYIGVGAVAVSHALQQQQPFWLASCLLGPALLLWILYRTIYPPPAFPNNLWPYVVLAWLGIAAVILVCSPALRGATRPRS